MLRHNWRNYVYRHKQFFIKHSSYTSILWSNNSSKSTVHLHLMIKQKYKKIHCISSVTIEAITSMNHSLKWLGNYNKLVSLEFYYWLMYWSSLIFYASSVRNFFLFICFTSLTLLFSPDSFSCLLFPKYSACPYW